MTRKKHDDQYYNDVARATFAESLRVRGYITTELRGSVASSDPFSTWSIPIEDPKHTWGMLKTFENICKEMEDCLNK